MWRQLLNAEWTHGTASNALDDRRLLGHARYAVYERRADVADAATATSNDARPDDERTRTGLWKPLHDAAAVTLLGPNAVRNGLINANNGCAIY